MNTYLGVDPGGSGALATVDDDWGVEAIRLEASEHEVSQWLRDRAHTITMAYLENVHSMPGQGVSSSFKFGYSYGFCRGLLVAHNVPFALVAPSKWQGAMSCRTGGRKAVSKARAQELFPRAPFKITNHTADAILLAEYCRRVHQTEGRP